MGTQFEEIGLRIRGLRESCDMTCEEMAADLGIPVEDYISYEETGADVPISAVFHIANKFGVDLSEILTGFSGKLDTYQVVRKGSGRTVDRYPGYHYQDLAWRFGGKIMQPLVVRLEPSDEPAALVTHTGQEFNLVLEGSVAVAFDGKEFVLEAGDSIYFNPTFPHGQKCATDVPATFVTLIAE